MAPQREMGWTLSIHRGGMVPRPWGAVVALGFLCRVQSIEERKENVDNVTSKLLLSLLYNDLSQKPSRERTLAECKACQRPLSPRLRLRLSATAFAPFAGTMPVSMSFAQTANSGLHASPGALLHQPRTMRFLAHHSPVAFAALHSPSRVPWIRSEACGHGRAAHEGPPGQGRPQPRTGSLRCQATDHHGV